MGRLFNHILCVLSPNIMLTVVSVRHTELNTFKWRYACGGSLFLWCCCFAGGRGWSHYVALACLASSLRRPDWSLNSPRSARLCHPSAGIKEHTNMTGLFYESKTLAKQQPQQSLAQWIPKHAKHTSIQMWTSSLNFHVLCRSHPQPWRRLAICVT